jgi:hypothetical protein
MTLGEPIGASLMVAMTMILGGIAVGTIPTGKRASREQTSPATAETIRA